MENPAKITAVRRVEWSDTDAAGVFHWGTAFRMVEAAEALLHERLGIRERTFGSTPRVHVEVTYTRELRFFDRVDVELEVTTVGRTSLRYAFTLTPHGQEEPAVGPVASRASCAAAPGGLARAGTARASTVKTAAAARAGRNAGAYESLGAPERGAPGLGVRWIMGMLRGCG